MFKGLIYKAGFVSDFSRYLENPLLLGYGVHNVDFSYEPLNFSSGRDIGVRRGIYAATEKSLHFFIISRVGVASTLTKLSGHRRHRFWLLYNKKQYAWEHLPLATSADVTEAGLTQTTAETLILW